MLPLPNLTTIAIGLYQDKLSDGGVKALLKACPNIQRLDFYGKRLSVAAIVAIGAAKSVEHLSLRDAKRLDDSWMPHLAAMTNLSKLVLISPALTDVHLHQLTALQNSLTRFNISKGGVTDKCLEDLKGFKKLQELNISETKITNAGVAQLKAALPNCNILK